MRTQLSKLFILMFVSFSLIELSYAEIINNEEAVEITEIQKMGGKTSGYFLVRQCKTCEQLNLKLDANSRAYKNGQQVNIEEVPVFSKSAITIFYKPKTKVVTRVRW